MLWLKQYNSGSLCWYPQWRINSSFYSYKTEYTTLCFLTWSKLHLLPYIPSWLSFNLGHITHSHTKVQQRQGGTQGATGWLIEEDNSQEEPYSVWSLSSLERTHTAVFVALAAGRFIWCIIDLWCCITTIRIRDRNVWNIVKHIVAMVTCYCMGLCTCFNRIVGTHLPSGDRCIYVRIQTWFKVEVSLGCRLVELHLAVMVQWFRSHFCSFWQSFLLIMITLYSPVLADIWGDRSDGVGNTSSQMNSLDQANCLHAWLVEDEPGILSVYNWLFG